MRIVGIVLIVMGLLGFVLGGFSFTRSEEVADLGPLEVEREETRTVAIPAVASGAAVVAGIALVFASTRRKEDG